jgi:hypothetical protein
LVEDEVAKGRFPRRHSRGVGGHTQDLAGVHEHVKSRVCEPDRFLGERIGFVRRSIETQHGRRVMAGESVVNQDRQKILVVRRLRRDEMVRGSSCAAVAVSRASYNALLGPRT